MQRHKILALAALTLTLGACATAGQGEQGPPAEMARYMDAFNRHDAVALAALYAEDGRILPPDRPMIAGRANILAFWQGAFNSGFSHMEKRPVLILSGGEVAAQSGNFIVTHRGQKLVGKDSVIWRRGPDNRWQIVSDMWNMDK